MMGDGVAGVIVQASAIVSVLGGIVTLVYVLPKYRALMAAARKIGVDTNVTEDAAADARWQRIVEAQTSSLVEPLRIDVARALARIEGLEEANAALRTRYVVAVRYIRTLLLWISRNMPRGMPGPPRVPAELADEV